MKEATCKKLQEIGAFALAAPLALPASAFAQSTGTDTMKESDTVKDPESEKRAAPIEDTQKPVDPDTQLPRKTEPPKGGETNKPDVPEPDVTKPEKRDEMLNPDFDPSLQQPENPKPELND